METTRPASPGLEEADQELEQALALARQRLNAARVREAALEAERKLLEARLGELFDRALELERADDRWWLAVLGVSAGVVASTMLPSLLAWLGILP